MPFMKDLTVDFCKKVGASLFCAVFVMSAILNMKKQLLMPTAHWTASIETIFLTGEPKYTSVASTIVRDIIRNGGDASHFLPEIVFKSLKR